MTIKRFGDLVEGDIILGPNGEHVPVVRAYDEHMPETMYEIETEDGSIIKASGNHLWYVETSFDYSYHRARKRENRRIFGKLNSEIIANLEGISSSEDEIETGLADMVALCEFDFNDRKAVAALERIASSIGHIAETSTKYEDFLTGEEQLSDLNPVRSYDAKLFTQQILSATGKRKYRKKFPLVIGRVVTTEEMVNLEDFDLEIPQFVENRS